MDAPRYLIVNADDFGQSLGVNRGVVKAHEQGIVTSASLMVRWPAASAAAAYARTRYRLSLGLHVDLGEWAYREQSWVPVYEVVRLDDHEVVQQQVLCQLAAFQEMVGRNPTHIDSHQHVHRDEPVRSILQKVADELAVPLREYTQKVRYCGAFYGQTAEGAPLRRAITVEALTGLLTRLLPGVTELSCHPGEADDLHSMYRVERAKEILVLCDPRVRAVLEAKRIQLCSFNDIP